MVALQARQELLHAHHIFVHLQLKSLYTPAMINASIGGMAALLALEFAGILSSGLGGFGYIFSSVFGEFRRGFCSGVMFGFLRRQCEQTCSAVSGAAASLETFNLCTQNEPPLIGATHFVYFSLHSLIF